VSESPAFILDLHALKLTRFITCMHGVAQVDVVEVVYTMVHEIVPMLCKICDLLLNLFHDHFGSDHEKNQNPKKTYLRPTL
jgi:hypothetical protein